MGFETAADPEQEKRLSVQQKIFSFCGEFPFGGQFSRHFVFLCDEKYPAGTFAAACIFQYIPSRFQVFQRDFSCFVRDFLFPNFFCIIFDDCNTGRQKNIASHLIGVDVFHLIQNEEVFFIHHQICRKILNRHTVRTQQVETKFFGSFQRNIIIFQSDCFLDGICTVKLHRCEIFSAFINLQISMIFSGFPDVQFKLTESIRFTLKDSELICQRGFVEMQLSHGGDIMEIGRTCPTGMFGFFSFFLDGAAEVNVPHISGFSGFIQSHCHNRNFKCCNPAVFKDFCFADIVKIPFGVMPFCMINRTGGIERKMIIYSIFIQPERCNEQFHMFASEESHIIIGLFVRPLEIGSFTITDDFKFDFIVNAFCKNFCLFRCPAVSDCDKTAHRKRFFSGFCGQNYFFSRNAYRFMIEKTPGGHERNRSSH